jgi:hypothetical protein
VQSGGVSQFVVDGEPIGKKAGMLKRCALAGDSGLTKPRLLSRSCLVKAAPHIMPPRLFSDEPMHILFEVLKSEPGASLDLNADPASVGPEGYKASLSLDSATRVPGDAFAVLHAMSLIGGLLDGNSALHRNSDGTPLDKQPEARQVRRSDSDIYG